MKHIYLFLLLLACFTATTFSQSKKVLFDNTKVETAGNADWIIDTDQPIPFPAQSGIVPSTPETFWTGAISAWGVDLVKLGCTVHTLTSANGISYGNAGNAYDLSNYDLYIVCEPQGPFSASEKQAIFNFVRNGGGLLMVADHDGSDRNSDGWDSPKVWNDLGIDTAFGMHFQSTSETNNNITQNSTNVAAGTDSIITGPAGTASILSYHNGTTVRFTGNNATTAGHVWMTGALHGSSQIMLATASYGQGKVGAVGDSSPADDSTGQSGNSLFNGWTGDAATDNIFFLNLSVWLMTHAAVVPPPPQVLLDQPADTATHVPIPTTFQWHSDSGASSYQIDVSMSNTFSPIAFCDTAVIDTVKTFPSLALFTQYFWRVRAKNAAGWGPYSVARSFTTWDVPPSVTLIEPANGATGISLPSLLRWYRYPLTPTEAARPVAAEESPLNPPGGYIFELDVSSSDSFNTFIYRDTTLTDTLKAVDGLSTGEKVYWRVRAKNPAGWGAFSETRSFTTWNVPPPAALVSPANGATVHQDPVPLVWRKIADASMYHLELSTSNLFDSFVISDSSLTDTVFAVNGLDTGVAYFWRVRTKNTVGWGDFSPARSFRRTLEETVSADILNGWNLISLPVTSSNGSRSVLFPTSTTSAYMYDGSTYVPRETLVVRSGYWLRFNAPQTVSVTGIPRLNDTLDVVEGWNLVGSLASPVATSSISSLPPDIIASPFFSYQTTYASVDTLKPMQGYWVKVSQVGKIILQSTEGNIPSLHLPR
ncbi:MAG: hypothetical protein HY033_03980 [Ignavibacteriae bacterium]|nr:hypothetical protein [Ignavibacteria bacterium]MBI3364046.1 hypothetical protein [Ignavibacteriota bacterium]